jgi:electron transfer flavoprotein alpha subunit
MTERTTPPNPEVWVFGDHRDYFKNRVTLELLAHGRSLAEALDTRCAVAVLGHRIETYIMEYIAHGAQAVYAMTAPHLAHFKVTTYARALVEMVRIYRPSVLLIGGTDFGMEFAPRVAKQLETGLSADCVELRVDPTNGALVQTAPAFGGRLLVDVITPDRRPQMATVRPGIFQERPHDPEATAPVFYVDPVPLEENDPLEVLEVEPLQEEECSLEEAQVVVSGGRGMGSDQGFSLLHRLARLLGGEVGGTRPAVIQGWIPKERMIGQTGRAVRPKVLLTFGTSGALQYTAAIRRTEFIIAVDRDPDAPIFRTADLGVVGDALDILPRLIRALEARKGTKEVSDAESARG